MSHAFWTSSASVIQQELGPNERLLWSGQPRRGIRLRAADAFLIPFSIFWCGFAIFWEVMALSATASDGGPAAVVFPLFGVPFVLIGLYLVFGRFLVEARMRANTTYGVTSERVIIVRSMFGRRTKSLNLRTLTDISLVERSDGSGTITLGAGFPLGQLMFFGAGPGAGQYAAPALEMIDSAKEVYEIIRKAQAEAEAK